MAQPEALTLPVRSVWSIGRNHTALRPADLLPDGPDQWPLLASKAPSALVGPEDPIPLTPRNREVDWEAELVVQLRAPAFAVDDPMTARDLIGAWGVGNDISDRWWQSAGGGQWTRGKSFPGFGPHNIGAGSPSADFCLDRQICCWVNDELVQDACLKHYLYPPEWLVWHLSQVMALEAGDLIFCGAFPGSGFRCSPPRFLRPGDQLRTWIEGLGELRNPIVASQSDSRARAMT